MTIVEWVKDESGKLTLYSIGKPKKGYIRIPCCSEQVNMDNMFREPIVYPTPCVKLGGRPMLYCPYCGKHVEWAVIE